MFLPKLIVFASFCYLVNAGRGRNRQGQGTGKGKRGYVLMDTSKPATCYPMPKNQICPSSFNHQIVGEKSNPTALAMVNLQAVKLMVAVADFFKDTAACKKNLTEYACSNALMQCVKSNHSLFGFVLTYDVNRTRQACENVKKSCSKEVQASTIFNCSAIQTDPFEYAMCNNYTTFDHDICPSTNYMYPVAVTKTYQVYEKSFAATYNSTLVNVLKSDACRSKFLNLHCEILRGGICVKTKRVFLKNEQHCMRTTKKCIVPSAKGLKNHMMGFCKLLPPKNATRARLPEVSNNNSGNVANSSGK